ncbi:MAG: tRNA (guanosine(18)-2'-O)-methyltransferase TrmH [Oceanospirillaceae bacterium]|nr:tRNA (guanosine(18)-2'-O)-methyltransferase TrmH [Oceanospirillaceae bacterium]MCP5334703.1 tRNA (guanosine(18)-2'-O)-methyltransferase TrmH [Oceanospirillaceae bacterium]MCP5351303.1 tRNA (guanosine(18)-2'-O)-methyltransferase TrmH [Oceanospirillaceae bacterium]
MTPERSGKIQSVLRQRQNDLTIITDDVHKPHNISAILRSCDAFAVKELHAILGEVRFRPGNSATSGAKRWVKLHRHKTLQDCISQLKQKGYRIYAAHLSEQARPYREIDYTQPTAILFGSELTGISAEAAAAVDGHIIIPMSGMVESLNVSVAAALILSEAHEQRSQKGMLEERSISDAEHQSLLFEWGHPKFAHMCRERNLPYPAMDEDGEIADLPAFVEMINASGAG